MASDRAESQFGSLMAIRTRNGIHKGPSHQGRGVAVIKMGEVYAADMIDDADRDRLDLSTAELERLSVRDGDLLFCRTSLVPHGVGHCALVRSLSEATVFASNLIRVRLDRQRAEPRYWLYYFRSPGGKYGLLSLARGTSVTTITGPDISSLSVPLPPLDEQRAIARVLGTLDDKIELNRRMNETLEAMARALFKSWFVDFDPVRAKAEGRDSGLPGPLADLFPARLVDSELGEIPEGWEVTALGDVVNVVGGTTPSTKVAKYWDGGTHCWATPKDLSSLSSPVLLDTERKITDAGLEKISSGLLPTGTLLLSSRAPIGYLAISEEPVAINQGFIGIPPSDGISNQFLLHWCNVFHEEIINYANGSTFLEISKGSFRDIPISIAGEAVIDAFDRQARPLHGRIVANERESCTLAAQRDALLPGLVSGEVRVQRSPAGATP